MVWGVVNSNEGLRYSLFLFWKIKVFSEESVDNYLKSALNGDIERIKGVSASIICGKKALCGTGFMDLKIDIKQLKNAIPVFIDKNNDGIVIEQKTISKIKPYPTKI